MDLPRHSSRSHARVPSESLRRRHEYERSIAQLNGGSSSSSSNTNTNSNTNSNTATPSAITGTSNSSNISNVGGSRRPSYVQQPFHQQQYQHGQPETAGPPYQASFDPQRDITAASALSSSDPAAAALAPSNFSPKLVENGHARPFVNPPPPHHRRHDDLLPSGASTPLQDRTASGNPVATFPPPAPTWTNMPNKGQLAILALSRFVDFFQMAAIQTFMVHQLKSFDPDLPDSTISHQSGVLQGAFTAAQIFTSILWGRAADQPSVGRKMVLLIGLVGTGLGCIGVGFSTSFAQAVFWRTLSGAINGTVGSARTMVAECTPKPWHPRAFLLLPAAFNFANVLGPILGGLLVDPYNNFAHLFAQHSVFGGADGVAWLRAYPYAVSNLLSAVLLFAESLLVHFFLDETLKGKRPMDISKFDPVRLVRIVMDQASSAKSHGYRKLQDMQRQGLMANQDRSSLELERLTSQGGGREEARPVQRLPFRSIWTSNVICVLATVAVFDFHMGAFANLWILFLATPREFVPELEGGGGSTAAEKPAAKVVRSAFKFAAGLAFPPATIGFAMAIIGFIGIALQFLLYPWANNKYGLMRCFRGSLFLFPLAYYLAPYIALLPSTSPPPNPSSGIAVWLGISAVLFLQVAARTFALPATIILVNNSSPHPSVLGTIHGIGQACSATFRTIGPMLAGYWYGIWLERGVVGMSWWIVATVAACGCGSSFWVRNGSGHEVFLPGEEVEMKEAETGGGSGDSR